MRGPMFQNRVAAIAIVVLTLAGVASLVGTEDNEGALATATQALAEKAAASAGTSDRYASAPAPATAASQPAAAPPPSPASYPTEFADDESLIDDAQGFDPSPFVEDPSAGEVVALVEGDDASAPSPDRVPATQPIDSVEP